MDHHIEVNVVVDDVIAEEAEELPGTIDAAEFRAVDYDDMKG